jgi:hypothetical protein
VVSRDKLFVANAGFGGDISLYTTSGALVNAHVVSGFGFLTSIAISGNKLFAVDFGSEPGTGTIGEYTLLGMPVDPALISGLTFPTDIAVAGNDLFVVSSSTGTIGKYTISGGTVDPALISGLNEPTDIAVVSASVADASSTWALLLLALSATFGLKALLRRGA